MNESIGNKNEEKKSKNVHIATMGCGTDRRGGVLELLLHSLDFAHALNATKGAGEELRADFGGASDSAHKLGQGTDFIRAEGTETLILAHVVERDPEFFVFAVFLLGVVAEMIANELKDGGAKVGLQTVVGIDDIIGEGLEGRVVGGETEGVERMVRCGAIVPDRR